MSELASNCVGDCGKYPVELSEHSAMVIQKPCTIHLGCTKESKTNTTNQLSTSKPKITTTQSNHK